MCVIAFSKAGEKVPTKEQFKQMWDQNSHGAGIMVDQGNGSVYYKKGLMTFDAFMDAYDEVSKKFDLVELASAFHFRIKTHGNTDAPTTHPFLLSPRYQDLRRQEYNGNVPVLMHNGTISGFGGWIDKLASDTQDFAATVGYRMLRKTSKGTKPSAAVRKAVEKLTSSSRVIVFYGDGQPITLGSWTEVDGIKYSNTIWKPSGYTLTSVASTHAQSTYHQSRMMPKPDQYGKYKDVFPSEQFKWIEFSSELEMKSKMYNFQEVVERGVKFYKSKYSSSPEKQITYVVDGLEVYTIEGKLMKQVYLEAQKKSFPDFEDLDAMDYLNEEDPESFYEILNTMSWDREHGTYINGGGDLFFVDYVTQEGYTIKAIQAAFKENWRYAKRDLQENNTITVDWDDCLDSEKTEFARSMAQLIKSRKGKKVNRERQAEVRLLEALAV